MSCRDTNFVNQVQGLLLNYGYLWSASLVYQAREYLKISLSSRMVTVVSQAQVGKRGVLVISLGDLREQLESQQQVPVVGVPGVVVPTYLIYDSAVNLLDWYTINYSGSLVAGVNWFADVALPAFELLPTSPVKTIQIQTGTALTSLYGLRFYENLEVFNVSRLTSGSTNLVFTTLDFPKLQELVLGEVVTEQLNLELPTLTHVFISSGSYGSFSIGSNAVISLVIDSLSLTQNQVDTLLFSMNGNGLSNGNCVLNTSGSASPSASGSLAVSALESKSWSVFVN